MGKLRLFQAAIVWHPDPNKEEEEKMDSVVLVEPYTVLEKDDKTLAYKLVRTLDEKYIDQMNQIELIIRPF
jgi:hypothetical protein